MLIVAVRGTLLLLIAALTTSMTHAADWPRFRGPNGTGVASDDRPAPISWSDTENLKWKAALPGPGSSSPIIVGDRVLITCWSGYADGSGDAGSLDNLRRHLLCYSRQTGEQLWSAEVPAVLPEDSYRGMFAENGYASHTPASDGQSVFVFFGKSGVHAYDMEGRFQWKADVGDDLDPRGWGSASSPILHQDLVIVTASIESHTIYGLDKKTGDVVWKQEADGFGATWGTPVIVDVDGRSELVVGVPYEFWALDPQTGKLLWYCESVSSNSMCSSVVAADSTLYAVEAGPGGGGAVAVRAGGKDDVTDSHIAWSTGDRGRIGTPVVYNDRLYWISSGVVNCLDAKTGRRVYQSRLNSSAARAAAGAETGRGGRRRPGGGRGGQDYSSPIVAGGNLYYVRRSGDTFVVKLGDEFQQLAVNRFASDDGDFNAAPAVSNGELFLRSSKFLYCVAAE